MICAVHTLIAAVKSAVRGPNHNVHVFLRPKLFLLGIVMLFTALELWAAAFTAPSNLHTTSVLSTSVTLAWTDNSNNEKQYTVERSVQSLTSGFTNIATLPSNTTSYTNSTVAPGTTYYYRVSAVAPNGSLATSSAISVTTPGASTIPNAPTSLLAGAVSSSQINLSWVDNSGNESGFKIERASSSAGPWSQIAIASANVTSYSNTGLTSSSTYYFRVRAYNAVGDSNYSNTASATTLAGTDTTPPTTPTGDVATAASCSQVNLSWNASTDTGGSGLKGYNIYRNGVFLKQVLAPAASTSDTGLTASTSYSYKVSAVDNAGNQSAQSTAANATTPACAADTTPPSMPVGLTATSVSSSQINLSWIPSTDTGGSGLAGYNVYRSGVLIGGTTLTSYSNTGLTVNTQYCYTVKAYDGAGNLSAQSASACATTQSGSLPGSYLWSKGFGSPADDRGQSVATNSTGNIAVTGYFRGTVNFGGGPLTANQFSWTPANTYSDIFLAKYAADGTHQWSKRFGDVSDDQGKGVAMDSTGAVVVTGNYAGSVDFGGGTLTTIGGLDIFLAKYAADGTHQWSKSFGSTSNESGNSVAIDSNGNVIVVGYFTGTIDFGGGPLTSYGGIGDIDIFVAKYSPMGAHMWSKRIGGASVDQANSVAVDSSGNVIVTGSFYGAVDFGGGALTSAGGADIFVAKYSPTGAHLWSKRFGSASDDYGYGVGVDGSGNVVVTGYFQGGANFGGGSLTSAGGYDIFVAKYAADGTHQWSKSFGSTSDDRGQSVAVDGNGNVLIAGYFNGSVDFGGGALASTGSYDMFVAKYSSLGVHQWSKNFGGTGADIANSIAVDGGGNAAVAGFFQGTVNFGGGGLTSAGGFDISLLKLAP